MLYPGRGKRKLDNVDISVGKKPRIDQDLSAIEASTMAVITIDEPAPTQQDPLRKSSELYKALQQPPMDFKATSSAVYRLDKHSTLIDRKEVGKKDSSKAADSTIAIHLDTASGSSCVTVQADPSQPSTSQTSANSTSLDAKDGEKPAVEIVCEKIQKKSAARQNVENKGRISSETKEMPLPPGHSNWLTPQSKKQADVTIRSGEIVSTVQVIDEETRMSAESSSRSQTPARNIPTSGMYLYTRYFLLQIFYCKCYVLLIIIPANTVI